PAATPAALAPRPAAPAPAAATPAPAAGAATGSASVQIGAFSSTEIADREYAAVAGRFGQYASGAQKRVTEVTSSSGSTLYRTTFSGLSRERAVAFCNALKAAGRDCIVR
ncbi:MAG: SPOR domain-containing protein, partial [Alphaproteobacteria bacterium]|nr:SPOR domain-containing protein [Alphaproteobacteria bacterium]MBU2230583.1 SPOR domain-containing protein [Alphaproteobacteria bacterium]